MNISEKLKSIQADIASYSAQLLVISKKQNQEDILKLYYEGHRVFGENQVQEMTEKHEALPKDIEWHMVGNLQSNKIKYIAPYVQMIHSVGSEKTLLEINKQAKKHGRVIPCLFEVKIAMEETKHGFEYDELILLLESGLLKTLKNVKMVGLMGMATFTANERIIQAEFHELATLLSGLQQAYFKENSDFKELSIGMSNDYKLALKEGSTMIRIGTGIFGARKTKKNEG